MHARHFFCAVFLMLFAWSALAEDNQRKFEVSEFTFAVPKGWEKIETTSAMRAAELRVSKGEEKAEVIFFYFGPGGAGGTEANIERWFRQFQEPRDQLNPKVEEETIGGVKVSFVHATGTYLSGLPAGPKTPLKNHRMLGAIVEGKRGHVFIRMTGPDALVKDSTPAFRKMVEEALK